MTKSEKLQRCRDCYNNCYNGRAEGNCFALESAKAATVFVVPTWQDYPEKHMKPIERLDCWQPNRGTSVMKRVTK